MVLEEDSGNHQMQMCHPGDREDHKVTSFSYYVTITTQKKYLGNLFRLWIGHTSQGDHWNRCEGLNTFVVQPQLHLPGPTGEVVFSCFS